MKKLRELLNEYEEHKEKECGYCNYDWRLNQITDEVANEEWITAHRVDDSELGIEESMAVIICKGYMFIQRLVENEKIDLDACEGEKTYNNLTAARDCNYTQYERLLMALSIQDDPIEFLCKILK